MRAALLTLVTELSRDHEQEYRERYDRALARYPEVARGAIEDLLITHADSPCGHVTVSVGVESIVPAPGQAAADLVEAADRALYAAKRRGRNTVIAHVPMVMSAA